MSRSGSATWDVVQLSGGRWASAWIGRPSWRGRPGIALTSRPTALLVEQGVAASGGYGAGKPVRGRFDPDDLAATSSWGGWSATVDVHEDCIESDALAVGTIRVIEPGGEQLQYGRPATGQRSADVLAERCMDVIDQP